MSKIKKQRCENCKHSYTIYIDILKCSYGYDIGTVNLDRSINNKTCTRYEEKTN